MAIVNAVAPTRRGVAGSTDSHVHEGQVGALNEAEHWRRISQIRTGRAGIWVLTMLIAH
jgi:hypothetical protein